MLTARLDVEPLNLVAWEGDTACLTIKPVAAPDATVAQQKRAAGIPAALLQTAQIED
jgi:hypothetical protein